MSQKKLCPVCLKKNIANTLELRQINFTTAIYLCKDNSCVYPEGYNWIEVERSLDDIFVEDFMETEQEVFTDTNEKTDDFSEWLNDMFVNQCEVQRNEKGTCMKQTVINSESKNSNRTNVAEAITDCVQIEKDLYDLDIWVNEVIDHQFGTETNVINSSNLSEHEKFCVPSKSSDLDNLDIKNTVINQKYTAVVSKKNKIKKQSKNKIVKVNRKINQTRRICSEIEKIIDNLNVPASKQDQDLKNYLLHYISQVSNKKSTPMTMTKPVSVVKPQVQIKSPEVLEEKGKVISITECNSLFNIDTFYEYDKLDAGIKAVTENVEDDKSVIIKSGTGKFKGSTFCSIIIKPPSSGGSS